jgi:opacity protein-like surface antigen
MRVFRICFVLGASVILSTAAFAQAPAPLPPEPDNFTLTPFIGVGFGGDLESAPATLGVAVAYGLTPRWAVEGDLHFEPDAEQGELFEFDTSLWALSANLLYHFTGERVTPYVAAGLGFATVDANLEDTGLLADDTSTELVWNWGGGIKTALSERFGIRADMRYFTGDDLVPDLWRIYGGVVIRRIGQ